MNYWSNYWNKTASPWVSWAVLAGGLASALILMMLVRIQNQVDDLNIRIDSIEQSQHLR